MAARLFNLLLCALLAGPLSLSAWAVARPENRVGGSPVFWSDFASQESAKPIAVSGENAACGYDFASDVHKYLYAQDDPVDNSDPSGKAVYVCVRPLNIIGLSILAPTTVHVFLAFDTDGITSTADLDRWTKVVRDGNKNVAGQYPGVNYSSDPYLTTFSFHPYSVFTGNDERNEAGVFTTTGSYVAYNDNIDHNAFYLASGGSFRYRRHLVTSDLNKQIQLYTLAIQSRDKNNSGHPDPYTYSAVDFDCASWSYTIVTERGGLSYPLFWTNFGVGIHGPLAPVGAGLTGLARGWNPHFDFSTGGIGLFEFSF